jgi:ABC-type multidrug transport system fused ATPase/permease subunit
MKEPPQQSLVSKVNDVLATRITMLVGSIWAFYVFVIFGLTPILWPGYETEILYWSNFLQLIFLPVITVGTAILSRNSERRAAEDHRTIRREFALLQDAHEMLHKSLREIAEGVHELLARSNQEDTTALRAVANEDSPSIRKTSKS